MTEKTEITNRTIGFSFHVSLEREIRTATGAKYPDKTIVKASLGGHAETFKQAQDQLRLATVEVRNQLDELQKKADEEPAASETSTAPREEEDHENKIF